ncbi:MAG: HAD family hydrolase [Gammaproteobacteria bacterium]|nr:HAD family hydrolase [Gammaproteobacteria bacterium]
MNKIQKWVFFDCFNTLIIEDKSLGRFPYLYPIQHIPVEAGIYSSADQFINAYEVWHTNNWQGTTWKEVLLDARLTALFTNNNLLSKADAKKLASKMLDKFNSDYVHTLLPADGVIEMLDRVSCEAKLAVVSNFYIAGWPQKVLTHFNLEEYFQFVLDSATFGWKKPEPSIYLEALRHAHLSQNDVNKVTFVGDSYLKDVLSPSKLGMEAVYYSPKEQIKLKNTKYETLSHWSEFW